jgi:hypothetical protein
MNEMNRKKPGPEFVAPRLTMNRKKPGPERSSPLRGSPSRLTPTIQLGAHSPLVGEAQQRLVENGASIDAAELHDHYFGASTKRAVQTFQAAHNLDHDGIIGPKTWAALEGDQTPSSDLPIPATDPTPLAGFSKAGVALGHALVDLRAKVKEIPPGSNRSPRIDIITGFHGAPGVKGPAWCAYAVTTWWNPTLPRMGSVDSILSWARKRGYLHDPTFDQTFTPQLGDIFCVVARRPDGTIPLDGGVHTGLVLAPDGLAVVRTIVTAEGNSSNRCRSIRRQAASLVFIRVPDPIAMPPA